MRRSKPNEYTECPHWRDWQIELIPAPHHDVRECEESIGGDIDPPRRMALIPCRRRKAKIKTRHSQSLVGRGDVAGKCAECIMAYAHGGEIPQIQQPRLSRPSTCDREAVTESMGKEALKNRPLDEQLATFDSPPSDHMQMWERCVKIGHSPIRTKEWGMDVFHSLVLDYLALAKKAYNVENMRYVLDVVDELFEQFGPYYAACRNIQDCEMGEMSAIREEIGGYSYLPILGR